MLEILSPRLPPYQITLHTMLASYPLGRPWRLDPHYTVNNLVKDSRKLAVVLEIVADACENGHRQEQRIKAMK